MADICSNCVFLIYLLLFSVGLPDMTTNENKFQQIISHAKEYDFVFKTVKSMMVKRCLRLWPLWQE